MGKKSPPPHLFPHLFGGDGQSVLNRFVSFVLIYSCLFILVGADAAFGTVFE